MPIWEQEKTLFQDTKEEIKIGDPFYYVKWCGRVVADVWTGHKNQRSNCKKGNGPFKSYSTAYKKYHG